MKDTIFHKLLKWVIASSVSLLALPISVFVIIFSLYPDLLSVNDFHFDQLKSYYELCDIAKDKDFITKNTATLYSNIAPAKINKNHLLVIDQTLSTVFEGIGLDNLKKDLILALKKSTKGELDTTSIKSLIYEKLIQTFDLGYNLDTLFVYFYNGNKDPGNTWIKVSNDTFTRNILEYLKHSEKIEGQETDFREIFKTVQEKITKVQEFKNLDCITFLSDFYHEPKKDLIDPDFINFKKVSKNIKINLIALWNTEYSGKDKEKRIRRQNSFIANFDKYFKGVGGATEKLFINDYDDSLYLNHSNFLEFEEIITYKTPKNYKRNDSPNITFFSQLSNSLKYDEAIVKIIMDTRKSFQWKIKSIFGNNKTFILFNPDCDTSKTNKCILNQWYEEECDSLSLSINLDHNLNIDDLKFCYVFNKDSKNKFEEYDIKIKKVFIEQKQMEILTVICNIFCILLIIILIAVEWLFYQLFYNYINYFYKHNLLSLLSWVFIIIILGVLFYFLLNIVFSAYDYCLPKTILIIITIMLFGKIICLWVIFLWILMPHLWSGLRLFNILLVEPLNWGVGIGGGGRRKVRYNIKEKSRLFISNNKKRICNKAKVFKDKIKSYINMIKETIQNTVLNIKNKIQKK